MKRYTMQWRDPGGGYHDDTDPHVREDSRGAWVEAESALAAIAVRDMRIAQLEARILELEEQLAEGAEIILALTGRKPVTDAGGNIVGFLEEGKQ